ncbi:hypothetical protein KCX83_06970 [Brucella oryzae]|uniref:hypothetical protein n=1 Tax=Brucella oryzae TaxID=335286 RepID=UPI001B818671|nr:hypothetical protein [Brucella oryzae]MBR7652063.1 hypothetical protein [Brucella oryzae]
MKDHRFNAASIIGVVETGSSGDSTRPASVTTGFDLSSPASHRAVSDHSPVVYAKPHFCGFISQGGYNPQVPVRKQYRRQASKCGTLWGNCNIEHFRLISAVGNALSILNTHLIRKPVPTFRDAL